MKKTLAWLLTLLMLLGMAAAGLAETVPVGELVSTTTGDGTGPTGGGVQSGTSLVVGSTTPMSGYFGLDLWGNNTSDLDVRSLIHGYATVESTKSLGLAINATAVSSVETSQESDGSRVYTIHLASGLAYNDGSAITAKDYVFSVLLGGSPYIAELGGTQRGMDHIVGYNAYQTGQANTISGVRLLSDTSFSLRISGDYLPYFYGMAMLSVTPYPLKVIAPGCDVTDDGQGAYISGSFSADTLRSSLMDPSSGYLSNPRVTSGPYSLTSYNASSNQAEFTINPQFKGNYEGQTPRIEKLTFKLVSNDTMISELESGSIDLLNKVGNGDAIAKGQVLAVEENKVQATSYLRTGFAFLSFACESGPTASEAVRLAIASAFDKDALMTEVTGGSARRVYAYYGLGQWMAIHSSGGLNMPQELAKLDVPMDLTKAKSLLESDGWTLNESGATFTEGTDTVRYREGTNGLEALEIKWAKTQNSSVADAIETKLSEALPQLGIKLTVTPLDFKDVLSQYYREETRTYNMFYLATNFTYVFDPYYDFNTGTQYQGMVNTTGLQDDELMRLAKAMRETSSNDMNAYAEKWLAFQQHFAELMPMIPLYSNVYIDFYSNNLQGYDILRHSGWGYAIPYAYLAN